MASILSILPVSNIDIFAWHNDVEARMFRLNKESNPDLAMSVLGVVVFAEWKIIPTPNKAWISIYVF
jgi:hypothetical protein